MKKKSLLWVLLALIFLAVFNTVFFVLGGTDRDASVWIAYGFIHFAYLTLLLTSLSAKPNRPSAFGVTLYVQSAAYFVIEFIIGLVFIFLKDASWKISLSVQVIVLGIYALLATVQLLGLEYLSVGAGRESALPVRRAAARVKKLLGKPDKMEANAAIQQLYRVLFNSPAVSSPDVCALENDIERGVTELEEAVAGADTERIIALSSRLCAAAETLIAHLTVSR